MTKQSPEYVDIASPSTALKITYEVGVLLHICRHGYEM